MKKVIGTVVLTMALSLMCVSPAFATNDGNQIDYNSVAIEGKTERIRAYSIDGKDYYLLRDIAYYSNMFFVDYNDENNAVMIYTETPFERQDLVNDINLSVSDYQPSAQRIYWGGKDNEINLEAINIDGYNYIPLKDMHSFITDVYIYSHNERMHIATEVQTYLIEAGDTLASISNKFYGVADRYKEIMEANEMKDASKIRPKMELIIP